VTPSRRASSLLLIPASFIDAQSATLAASRGGSATTTSPGSGGDGRGQSPGPLQPESTTARASAAMAVASSMSSPCVTTSGTSRQVTTKPTSSGSHWLAGSKRHG
jgi:hypothetical protein